MLIALDFFLNVAANAFGLVAALLFAGIVLGASPLGTAFAVNFALTLAFGMAHMYTAARIAEKRAEAQSKVDEALLAQAKETAEAVLHSRLAEALGQSDASAK